MSNLQKLFYILNKNQKANLFYLSLILLLVSALEIFFLHSILILVEIITNNKSLNFINFQFINFGKHENIKIALIGFIFLFLIKSLTNIFAIKYEANFIYRTRENLTKNEKTSFIWTLIDHKEIKDRGKSRKIHLEVNCINRKFKMHYMTIYKDQLGQGDIVEGFSISEESEWTSAIPGSTLYPVIKVVCN